MSCRPGLARVDREETAALVADCDYLDEVAVALLLFAAEAARMASAARFRTRRWAPWPAGT